jgi:hypothetical protein
MPTIHYLNITAPLPVTLPPELVVAALHDHSTVITLQKLTTTYKALPKTPAPILEDQYFAPSQPISTYEVTEGVLVLPGIGSLGVYPLKIELHCQDTQSGLKTRAGTSSALVRAEYHVEPVGDMGEGRFGGAEWVLVETASVECAAFFMPFVKKSFEGAHRDICRLLVEKVERQHDLDSGR